MSTNRVGGMGWNRDLPDFRDHHEGTAIVADLLAKSKRLQSVSRQMPPSVDLRRWCSPVEDQEQLGSCTANAGVGLLEYYERHAFGKHIDASRIFLYKITRTLLGLKGDSGASLRGTMKAMALFGILPEQYWAYNVDRFDVEPPAFCYAFAENYKSLTYYRLDPPGKSTSDILHAVKEKLAAGLPSMFGFSVYSSIPGFGDNTGDIPFPEPTDNLEGGHAVVAVGYDDARVIGKEKGALLIRNSWGVEWGEKGYGWLPYRYVEVGLADDFWALVKADYVNTELFN